MLPFVKTTAALAALVALGLAAAHSASAQAYTYTTLDDPLASSYTNSFGTFSGTYAGGLNDLGQIVGYYYDAAGSHGFVYSAATGYSTLDDPSALSGDANGPNGTGALGINNAGQIVGGYTDSTGSHGFLDTPGAGFTQIDDPNATGTNNSTFAQKINNAGVIVGNYNLGAVQHGFVLTAGTYSDVVNPAATGNTTARDVNDAGQIVGEYQAGVPTPGRTVSGYLFTPGAGFTPIKDPVAPNLNLADGVNNAGQVAGSYFNNTGRHSFVDTIGANGSVFTPIDDPLAVSSTFVQDINNSGQVAGYYTDANNVTHGFFAAPAAVPEASSVVSLGLLLLGAGGLLSRKRRAKL